jgi:hypothetical protein
MQLHRMICSPCPHCLVTDITTFTGSDEVV